MPSARTAQRSDQSAGPMRPPRPTSALSMANQRHIVGSVHNFTAVRRAAREATVRRRLRIRYGPPISRDVVLLRGLSRRQEYEERRSFSEEEEDEEGEEEGEEGRESRREGPTDAEVVEKRSSTETAFDTMEQKSSDSLQQARDFNSKVADDFHQRGWDIFPLHQVAARRSPSPAKVAAQRPRTATSWRQKRPPLADTPPPIRRQQPSRLSCTSLRV